MEGSAICRFDGARVVLPAAFRAELGPRPVVISKGLNSCLFFHTPNGYGELVSALSNATTNEARLIRRFFLADAVELSPDSRGRVSINRRLLEFAGIRDSAVWRGKGQCVELWDTARFETMLLSAEPMATLYDLLTAIGSRGSA